MCGGGQRERPAGEASGRGQRRRLIAQTAAQSQTVCNQWQALCSGQTQWVVSKLEPGLASHLPVGRGCARGGTGTNTAKHVDANHR